MANSPRLFTDAHRQGLRRAAAQAVVEVDTNFERRGRPQAWSAKPYSKRYRKGKQAGAIEPGRQVSTSGSPDNMLTGALRMAATTPRSRMAREYIDLWPLPVVKLGRAAVGKYADHVNAQREYFVIPPSAEQHLADQYKIGFMNVLLGILDPVGRQFG